MFRWLLNNLSTESVFLVVVGSITLTAILGTVIVQKRYPNLSESAYEERIGNLRVDFGLFYFLILALAIAGIQGRFDEGGAKAEEEATSIAQISLNSRAFTPEFGAATREALREYLHAVVDDEFETLREGRESPRAHRAFNRLYEVFQKHEPTSDSEQVFYDLSLDKLDRITESRRQRLAIAGGPAIPPMVTIFLLVGVFMLLVFSFPATPKKPRSQILIISLYAILASFAFLLTILLDYPFSGEVSVSTDVYKTGGLAEFFR